MSRLAGLTVKGRRLIAAALVVSAIVFGPAVADIALRAALDGGASRENAFSSFSAGSVYDVLDAAESKADASISEVPEQFDREIGVLPGARDVRVSEGLDVVGYVVDGSASSAVEAIDAAMEERGWTAVGLGGMDGRTYMKREGAFTWALMTATQVGSSTSVVVRCA